MRPAKDNKESGVRQDVRDLVAANKTLLKENRELRAENKRLIEALERARKQTKDIRQK